MRATEFITEEPIQLRGFGPSEKTKEWVAKVNAKFPESPLSRSNRLMTFGKGDDMQIVQFELTPKHGNNVELKWIQATPMRGGAGSKAMKILQDLAQQDGITLTLFPWDKGAVSQAKLIKFYKKHGFQHIGKSKNMQWEPIKEQETEESKSKEWIKKVYDEFPSNPIHQENRYIEIDDAYVQFRLEAKSDNTVEIAWIQAVPARQGAGTKVIKMLQDLAQKDGISLVINPWKSTNINPRVLSRHYKKHGFKNAGIRDMQWKPVTEVQTIAHTEEDDKFWNFKMMQYFNELQYKQKLKEAGSIGGLNLLVGPHGYSDAYFFMDNDKPVGLVAVVKKHDPEYRTISMFYLEPAYRRQGIAFDFYKMLLNDYNLMSDKIQSAAMQKVWEKLASMPGYSMKEVGERYLITKDTENTQQLDESLSRIVYHYTTTWAASNILASGKFELSSSLGSIEQQYAPKGYHYFLSTTRTPRGGYHDTIGQSAIMFVLDGNYYNSKYPSKPVDYWENRDPAKSHHRTHEAEDRLFSKEPTIPINGVTAVHMFIKDDADPNVKGLARTILLEAKKRGIPAYYYTDQAAWRNLDTTKTSQLNTLAGQRKIGRSFSRHRGWLIPWLEVMQATDRSQLSSKAKGIIRNLDSNYYQKETAQGE